MVQRKRAFWYASPCVENFETIAKLSQVCHHNFHLFAEQSARLSGGGGFTRGNDGRWIFPAWFEAVVCTETVAGVPEEDSSSLIVETVNRIKTTTAATMYQDVLSKIQSKSTQSSQKQATYFLMVSTCSRFLLHMGNQ